jgi:hypothetical protein
MNEEVEQVDEADVKSKPVLHKGKSIGETGIDTEASPGGGEWYAKHHKSGMNTVGFDSRKKAEAEVRAAHGIKEEAEQIDELKASTLGSYIAKSSADEKSRREKGVAVSKELSAKTGMKFGTSFDPKIHSKNASRSANRAVAIKKLTGQAKVNANEEAEGKVAVTPKEKSLAAHHGDKTKITFGDVLKARLKSAAAKAMNKGK